MSLNRNVTVPAGRSPGTRATVVRVLSGDPGVALTPSRVGSLPGSVVVTFATIDALAHAWDLSSSVGRAIEFEPRAMPSISAIVEAVCTDDVRAMGLIKPATEPPTDATDTERLMAAAGRTIDR